MFKWSPKTPHTQFLCRVQFHKLSLKTHRVIDFETLRFSWNSFFRNYYVYEEFHYDNHWFNYEIILKIENVM